MHAWRGLVCAGVVFVLAQFPVGAAGTGAVRTAERPGGWYPHQLNRAPSSGQQELRAVSRAPSLASLTAQLEWRAALPLVLDSFAGPFPTMSVPTGTPRPRRTDRPTAPPVAPGASPTPTLAGEPVAHPGGAAIILQIGWAWTDQIGSVWAELDGTPWFTLYGDGRVIAGHALFDRRRDLYVGQLTEHEVQRLLRELVHHIGFFSMASEYAYPGHRKPEMHVWLRTDTGTKRVSILGWHMWVERDPPAIPGAFTAARLVRFVTDLETRLGGEVTAAYTPQSYTLLAQELVEPMRTDAPAWPHRTVSVAALADSAPLIAPGSRLVGHMEVGADLGAELWQIVAPVADRDFPGANRAAEFVASDRHFAVGVRPEVPGGSRHLTDFLREIWYRPGIEPPEP